MELEGITRLRVYSLVVQGLEVYSLGVYSLGVWPPDLDLKNNSFHNKI